MKPLGGDSGLKGSGRSRGATGKIARVGGGVACLRCLNIGLGGPADRPSPTLPTRGCRLLNLQALVCAVCESGSCYKIDVVPQRAFFWARLEHRVAGCPASPMPSSRQHETMDFTVGDKAWTRKGLNLRSIRVVPFTSDSGLRLTRPAFSGFCSRTSEVNTRHEYHLFQTACGRGGDSGMVSMVDRKAQTCQARRVGHQGVPDWVTRCRTAASVLSTSSVRFPTALSSRFPNYLA